MPKRARSWSAESHDRTRARRRVRSDTPNDGRKQYQWREGDVLRGGCDYEVVRKLGEGTFAKVVLCEQMRLKERGRGGVLCAVKVVHDIRRYHESSKIEAQMIRDAQRHDPAGKHGLVELLDMFQDRGHTCLVFPRYGPSLYCIMQKNGFKAFPDDVLRGVAHHTLKAVAFLHSLRMVHTDIKPENVLLKHPRTFRTADGLHVPVTSEIILIDFGSVQYDDEYKGTDVQTRNYRAPEVIATKGKWSMPSDVWSVGCMLVELVTGSAIFDTDIDAEHLAMMEVAVEGRFDADAPELLGSRDLFDSCGAVRWPAGRLRGAPTLRRLCAPLGDPRSGRNPFFDLVRALLRLDPIARATAKEALTQRYVHTHDW